MTATALSANFDKGDVRSRLQTFVPRETTAS